MPPLIPPTSAAAPSLSGRSLGVLRNPRSGANLRAAASMERVLAAHPAIPCLDVEGPASVAAALREMADRDVDVIAISGGDGTVHAVLDTVFGASPFRSRPLLAVLRGGTANMTARDVGMRGRQDHALAALIERIGGGGDGLAVTERAVMRIDRGDGLPPIHGMFFGAAAISQGIEYCKRKVHTLGLRGEIGPAVTMVRFVVAMARGEREIVAPVPIMVSVDGGARTAFDCEIVYVSTLEELVLGLRPWWGDGTGPLHYASVRAAPKHWIRALPGLLRGRPNRFATPANGYESRNADRLAIRLDSPFFVDGETFSPNPHVPLTFRSGGSASFVTLR